MKFALGEQQKEAVELIKDFVNSKEEVFSLQGFAGTGKSFIIKVISDYFESKRINYLLCAPTHKAKLVLENFTGQEAVTLHKLLALAPNIEILELDFNNLNFVVTSSGEIPRGGVIICDEASMISDDLFSLLTNRCKENKCKIIFVSDKSQLRPVNAITHSKVFNIKNQYNLTKIYRQQEDSGLSKVLPILRNSIIKNFYNEEGINGSLYCISNIRDLFIKAKPYFEKAIRNGDILEAKMLAYTNDRVNALNKKTREMLFGNKEEYSKDEFLTCSENLEFNGMNFWNSMDYIITSIPVKKDVYIPSFGNLPGYELSLYDSSTKTISNVDILSKNILQEVVQILSKYIEEVRQEAVNSKIYGGKTYSNAWKNYYSIIKSFTSPINMYYENRLIRKKSFDYGYAITTHRAQGSSINNVFIDMRDVFKCRDLEELRQLQYVSISRARTNVYLFK